MTFQLSETVSPLPPGSVVIPQSTLQLHLNEARSAQRELEKLILELESQYLGRRPEKFGGWRQDPQTWQRLKRS